jgi:hypothetical protein
MHGDSAMQVSFSKLAKTQKHSLFSHSANAIFENDIQDQRKVLFPVLFVSVWGFFYLSNFAATVYLHSLALSATHVSFLPFFLHFRMVHSPDSSAPSLDERYDSDDPEDDADTTIAEETRDAGSAHRTFLSGGDDDCMVLFCAAGSDVVRACGTNGVCHRTLPALHRSMVRTPTSHAQDGWYQPLSPLRSDSRVLDGRASSYRCDEEHQADLQRRSDENQMMARRLADASPDNGRSFREEADGDEVEETPVRTTTHGRVPGSMGTGILTSSGGCLTASNDPVLPPTRTPPDSVATMDVLTLLVQESLKGQAALQDRVMASTTLMETLMAQLVYRDQVANATPAPGVTTIDDDSDDPSVEALGPKSKSRHVSKKHDRKKRGTKGRRDKGPSTWYGVAAGQHGDLRPSLSTAKACAKSYDPRGRVSSKFDTKAEAEAWVADNIDDPDSSDTASGGATTDASASDIDMAVKPSARRGGLVPPGRLPPSLKPAFELVTQDPSVGKEDELFGIKIRKELEVLKALAPKNTVEATQRALAECIVDGTMLPGTSSERFDTEDEGGYGGDSSARLAATLSRVIRETKTRKNDGISRMVDEGFQSPSRVSLRGVKNLEQLHTMEQELGQAIPHETRNMKLAFGAALHHLGWTDSEEDMYLLGGHFPYISTMIMRYYSDLVRELARRAGNGWARVKIDIDYFVKKLQAIRINGSTRFLVMVRTYIFLRDQQHVNFASIDRMTSQLNGLYDKMNAGASASTEAAVPGSMCQKCKQKGLHKGGRPACPFRDLGDASARSAGTLAAKLCIEGSTKTEAYQKANLRFADDD